MTEKDTILMVETVNKVCRLTLNRPERRNALSRDLSQAIRHAVLRADADPDVALITVTGAGDAFCAGADLKAASEGDQKGIPFRGPLHEAERSICEVFINSRKPSLAIVNGPAVAGGCELALSCDMRIAADDTFLQLPEARRGMGAHFASVALPQMVPSGIAMEWLYTGRRIPVEEAARWGLINQLVPRTELAERAEAFAAEIVASAPLSLIRLKLTFRKSQGLPLQTGLRLDTGPDPYASEDRKEGARAFLERRAPVWTGR